MLKPGYERVHTMTDYHDGPRRGVADFDGAPHLYESEWDRQAAYHQQRANPALVVGFK